MPEPVRTVTCNFFQVVQNEEINIDLMTVIDKIVKQHDQPLMRNYQLADSYVRIEEWKKNSRPPFGDYASGVFLKLRHDNSARVARLDKFEIEHLDRFVPSTHSLTEFFVFCYFARTKTIVIQRNMFAGGHMRLAEYINEKFGRPAIDFDACVAASGLDKFRDLEEIYKAEVRVAIPTSNVAYQPTSDSVDTVVGLGDAANAAEITIKFTKGHRKAPLDMNVIKSLVNGFFHKHPGTIRSAKAVGRPSIHHEEMFVDMLNEKITERVLLPSTISRFELDHYNEALITAYTNRLQEVETLYPPATISN